MKIIINNCYGGFNVSPFGIQKMMERKGIPVYFYKQTKYEHCDGIEEYTKVTVNDIKSLVFDTTSKDFGEKTESIYDGEHYVCIDEKYRTDADLIAVIEEYGTEKISGSCSKLIIEDIPTGTAYKIDEYDGYESIEYKESDEWDIAT